jgi:hypothetical protein
MPTHHVRSLLDTLQLPVMPEHNSTTINIRINTIKSSINIRRKAKSMKHHQQ